MEVLPELEGKGIRAHDADDQAMKDFQESDVPEK